MTIPQCRAARALIGWSAADLAEHALIGSATVRRFESGQAVQDAMVAKMAASLGEAGVDLITNGVVERLVGTGVRLKARLSAKALSAARRPGAAAAEQMPPEPLNIAIKTLWKLMRTAAVAGTNLEGAMGSLSDFRCHWADKGKRELPVMLSLYEGVGDAHDDERLRAGLTAVEAVSAGVN